MIVQKNRVIYRKSDILRWLHMNLTTAGTITSHLDGGHVGMISIP